MLCFTRESCSLLNRVRDPYEEQSHDMSVQALHVNGHRQITSTRIRVSTSKLLIGKVHENTSILSPKMMFIQFGHGAEWAEVLRRSVSATSPCKDTNLKDADGSMEVFSDERPDCTP